MLLLTGSRSLFSPSTSSTITTLKVVHLVPNWFFQFNTFQHLHQFQSQKKPTLLSAHCSKDSCTKHTLLKSLIRIITNQNYTMSSKPILYSYFRSGASWRIRIALEYKEIDYEYRAINLLKREQLGDEFLKINPLGQVPAFQLDGKILTQSLAILELLEDLYPKKPMLPQDPFLKAKVREITELINSGIQPLQNLSVILKVSDDPVKRNEWSNYWITKGLAAVEKLLGESSGKYCVGDNVTWADCSLVPQFMAAERFNVDMDAFPNIKRVHNALLELDCCKRANAFVQPDCPPELRQP